MVLLLAVGAGICLIGFFIIAYDINKKRHRKSLAIEDRKQRLYSSGEMHAWFDPDFKDEWGSSIYEMKDGTRKEVTMVSDDRGQMRHRHFGPNTRYLGKAARFARRGSRSTHHIGDYFDESMFGDFLVDIAMLAFLDEMFYSEHYPYDESYDDPPDGINEEIFAESVTESFHALN